MARTSYRTKEYLSLGLKEWVTDLKPRKLHLSEEFIIKIRYEGEDWIQISIKDPSESAPRYFTLKVTENVG